MTRFVQRPNKICQNCCYWLEYKGKQEGDGECRIDPPQRIHGEYDPDHPNSRHGYWPHTGHEDWCGKFSERFREAEEVMD